MREKKNEPAYADFALSWSYITGFFDSHGSVHKTPGGGYQLTFSKTNKQIISMIRDFVSPESAILSDNIIPIGNKKMYRLIINNYHDVCRIAKRLLPLSIVQRENLSDALWSLKGKGYHYKSRVEKREWTEEEKIVLLLTMDEPRAEVADYLKRTVASVDLARLRIKKERCKK